MASRIKPKRSLAQQPTAGLDDSGRDSKIQAHPSVPHTDRLHGLDALRGLACCLMLLYHLSFDLNFLGFLQAWGLPAQVFNEDSFWLAARGLIVSLFLVIVGFSLQLSARRNFEGFWLRLLQLLGCACLVSVGSAIVFPQSWIFFGILHFIILASLIARLVTPYPALCWPLAGLILTVHLLWQYPLLSAHSVPQIISWIDQSVESSLWLGLKSGLRLTSGLVSHKPYTEDYVPLFPWLACVLIGIRLGHLATLRLALADIRPVMRPLAWLGRHSLSFYMLHQPVLLGLLFSLQATMAEFQQTNFHNLP